MSHALRLSRLPLPARIAIAMGIAFAAGLLLFALVYFNDRAPALPSDGDHVAAPSQREPIALLPAPQRDTAGDDGDIPGLHGAAPGDGGLDTMAPPTARTAPVPPPQPPADVPPAAPATAAQSAPVVLHRQPPAYPRASLRRGESGEVVVAARVDTSGRPQDVTVARSSGHPALDRAAVRAVQRWRFEPARRGGQPVEGQVQVPVEFIGNR